MADPEALAVAVLAGGAGRRLGGAGKPLLTVAGVRLLDRVLGAVPASVRDVVVVGDPPPPGLPRRSPPTHRPPPRYVREQPAGGGPVAALAAALPLVSSAWLAVLAADLPFLRATDVALLHRRACEHGGGAIAVDGGGRDQHLLGVWRTAALRAAVPAPGTGLGFARVVTAAIDPARVTLPPPAVGGPAWLDCDDVADLRHAEHLAATGGPTTPAERP